jgi:putative transposase
MNAPVIQSKQTRKKFDQTFKRHAVELWLNSGKAATEVAAELGIDPQRLAAWRTRFAPNNWNPKMPVCGARTIICGSSATFKKNFGHPLRAPIQRFQRIDAMKAEHPVRSLCEALAVSASGYYDWVNRQTQPSPRTQENARVALLIVRVHQASRQTYGSPRIQVALDQAGHAYGRHRIARLMRQQGLWGRAKSRFRCTTDSNHDQPIAPNRLPDLPAPSAPNQVWLGDITYVATEEGWLYLAGIMDLYSRRLTGWAMSEHIDTELILAAWGMALTHRQPTAGLVFHSDRGVQYASHDYRQALHNSQAIASMSRKGNCYDAAMESFWSTLKQELIYRCHFKTRDAARQAIFDFIEVFYNRCRLHSSLGYRSPIDFETQNN